MEKEQRNQENIEDEVNEVISESEEEETNPVEGENNTEKKFSQADVDKILKTRLSKSKYDAKLLTEQHSEEIKGLESQIEEQAKIIEGFLESDMQGFDSSVLELLEKLPTLEKVKWVQEHKNIVRKSMPQTPKTNSNGEKTVYKPIGRII